MAKKKKWALLCIPIQKGKEEKKYYIPWLACHLLSVIVVILSWYGLFRLYMIKKTICEGLKT